MPLASLRLIHSLLLSIVLGTTAVAGGYRAGVAKEDITPTEPIRLSGYAVRTTAHEAVDQSLYVRALALEDPGGRVSVLVSVDALGIAASLRERICGAIRGPLGIYRPRIAVGATHSHSAPCMAEVADNLAEYTPGELAVIERYTDQVRQAAIVAVRRAVGSLEPVELAFGEGTATFAANRRTAGGPVDHTLPVLVARRPAGDALAIVFSYACHATTIPPGRNRVCGDWPGYGAEFIEASREGCVALPLIGCGADANPQPRAKQTDAVAHGQAIARAVESVLAGDLRDLRAPLDAQLEYVNLPYARLPTEDELRARLVDGRPEQKRLARRLLGQLAARGALPSSYLVPVQTWSFGDELTMIFLAGEVVVDYALRLRRELAGTRLWVSSYMNDAPGYVGSKRILDEGGYEADGSTVWYGLPARWADSVEEILIGKVKELVRAAGDPLARIKPPPPVSPAEAVSTFRTLDGLVCELAAVEPEVVDPVAIAFDERARMFVCEMRDYPLGPGGGKPSESRVRLVEDRDGDGRYETATVYADHVPYANGVAPWKGGVFVTSETEIIWLADRDGDGRAEERHTVFDGFRTGNSQHLLCMPIWGPDGQYHGLSGDGGDIRTLTAPERDPVRLRWTSFRFDPRDLRIQDTAGSRGGYGIAFTRLGERLTVSNSMPAYHVALDARYLARNPHVDTPPHIVPIAASRAIFPIHPKIERFNDPWDDSLFTGACGLHVFHGDALGAEYEGDFFVCEPVSALVYRGKLDHDGALLRLSRADAGRDFLASTDLWFRPVQVTTGPDGALYVVDMYREVIEHPEWIPLHIQKLFDLRNGMGRGRIWRVRRAGEPPRSRRFTGAETVVELAGALAEPNVWARETAHRLLLERADTGDGTTRVESAVRAALEGSPSGDARTLVLSILGSLHRARASDLERGLRDADPAVRRAAALVSESWLESDGPDAAARSRVVKALAALAGDAEAPVRFQAAFSLGSAPVDARRPALERIALRDAGDRWVRVAVLGSWAGSAVPLLRAALSRVGAEELLVDAAKLTGARRQEGEVVHALTLLLTGTPAGGGIPTPVKKSVKERALAGLFGKLGATASARVLAGRELEAMTQTRRELQALFERKAREAADEARPVVERLAALRLLGYDGSVRAFERLAELLDPRHPQDIQSEAAHALARFDGELRLRATNLFVDRQATLTPAVRDVVLGICLRDQRRVKRVIAALEAGDIDPRVAGLETRRRLLEHPDSDVRARAEKVFADSAGESDRGAVIERYRRALADPAFAADADATHGRQVFVDVCTKCHQLEGEGALVGPELSGLAAKDPEQLLTDILDPNQTLLAQYAIYTIVTADGRVLSGLLLGETPATLVVRESGGATHTVRRGDAVQVIRGGGSVMPEGLEEELPPAKLRDLIAFLRGETFR